MNPLTQIKKLSILPLLIVLALAVPVAALANAVTEWNQIAINTLVAFPAPAGGAAPTVTINLGMTQGAVYDALNAIEPQHHRPYLLNRRFAATASKEAAVATAAYRVLTNIVQTVPLSIPFPNKAALQHQLDLAHEASLAAIPNTPFKAQGIAAGNAAADAMITARHGEDFCPCADGRFGPPPALYPPAPGIWRPTPPNNALDPTSWVGGVRPFLIQSSSQFRTDGPNALTSPEYAVDFNEVKELGSLTSITRTPEQTHSAIFWQSAVPATWNAVARNLVNDPTYGIDIVGSARLFAMMNLSAADAAINGWNDKYYWQFWRPITAIREADTDGNPATEADPAWLPLFDPSLDPSIAGVGPALTTPPYPDHPSGHLSLDGAYVGVLQMFFGTDEIRFGVTSSRFPLETRYFDRFSDAVTEIIGARIWGGIHFRTADIQGQILGREIADYMAEHYFQPVQRSGLPRRTRQIANRPLTPERLSSSSAR
jgi:hypothetical protein